jgi:MFS family permease
MTAQVLERNPAAPRKAGAAAESREPGLLAIPGFLAMSVSNGVVHSFSMRLHGIIVAWLVLEMTNSKLWLGVVTGGPALAVVAFSLLGGMLADSREAKRTLFVTRALLTAVSLAAAAVAMGGGLSLGLLTLYALLSIGLMAIDMPVARTLVLQAVGPQRLVAAGAANLVTQNLFNIGGPLALGLIITRAGAEPGLFLLAAGYAAAMLLTLRVPRTTATAGPGGSHPLRDIVAGLAYVRATPAVRALVCLGFLVVLAGVYFGMVPVYARDVLRVGPQGLGLLAASFSVGSLGGALYMTARGALQRRGRLVAVLSVVFGAGMAGFALSGDLALSCGISFVMGAVSAFWQNALMAMLQTTAAPKMRGRAVAVFTMAFQLTGAGWLLGGVAATLLSVQAAVLLAGLAFAGLSTLIFALNPEVRRID